MSGKWEKSLHDQHLIRKDSSPSSLSLNDDVIAGRAVEDIQARTANQHIVSSSAIENVVALAADQDIVTVPSVRYQLNCSS